MRQPNTFNAGGVAPLRSIVGAAVGLALAAWAWQAGQPMPASAKLPSSLNADAAEAARAALRVQPLNGPALRDLAIATDEDLTDGGRLIALAGQVTRRDPATQLILLETSTGTGDIRAALAHYDALLSTYPVLQAKLLETLSGALPEPEIAQEVLRYSDRPWFLSLLETTAGNPGGADIALSLTQKANILRNPQNQDRLAPRLIQTLAQAGRYDQARTIANAVGQAGWEKLGFSAASTDTRLGNFAWQLAATPSVRAEWREPSTFAVSLEPGRRVQVAYRTTSLDPGAYRLSFAIEAPSPPGAAIQWLVNCSDAAATEIGSYSFPVPSSRTVVDRMLTIPGSCPQQNWALVAEALDAQIPSQALISQLDLVRQ